MVGARKLAKINYRLQDLATGDKKNEFMGGISFVASGDLWQLPPVKDKKVTEKHNLDGRLDCAPSHWIENFRIFYLTEKMRSQKDPYFSELSDRVARGKQTEEDELYLKSRIKKTDSEHSNDNFRFGKLSIIVTTNKKRDFENARKLAELLPNEKEYSCNSVDRVINLPGAAKIPKKYQENPGNTGNLEAELKLKVGAPVIVTTNHPKKKYKDDGIMNGARGYVQAIQVSKDNPEKVEIVWVVFNKETVGKLYRFEHAYLRKSFNPGHELATPILPERKNFKLKFGNVEIQRTNFALSMAYALTSHKCQGETLEEVIIDFGRDKVNKINNYIVAGGFYVALTRVKMGSAVFLRSFERSYIKVDKTIEDKVEAMRKFRQYNFKKIYLDERIFENIDNEIKVGYLNVNGLLDGNHGSYLNSDHNLKCLDILVLAETKLDKSCTTDKLIELLSDWKILRRYDADDGAKHMGLMLLAGKESKTYKYIKSVTYQKAKRQDYLQIQGLIVRFSFDLNIGFLYCRSTPSNSEIKSVCENFKECNILMGDLNLSHRNKEEFQKVLNLCHPNKVSALSEITRPMSNNQLDYILIDEELNQHAYVTSFNNFISDHSSVVLRLGLHENPLTEEMKMRINFDSDSHLKTRVENTSTDDFEDLNKAVYEKSDESLVELNEAMCQESEESFDSENDTSSLKLKDKANQNIEEDESAPDTRKTKFKEKKKKEKISQIEVNVQFSRRFRNPDLSTCWLNSCLQLILSGFDHLPLERVFESELGSKLYDLKNLDPNKCIDPTDIKELVIFTEDMRIARRKSEVTETITDKKQLQRMLENIDQLYLNMRTGQQCVRDFFICLHENMDNWIDVYQTFSFTTVNHTICMACGHRNSFEQHQIHLELDVPPEGSILSEYVEQALNDGTRVEYRCEDGCNIRSQAQKQTLLKSGKETQFIIVMLRRTILSEFGPQVVFNNVSSERDIDIR